jgi:hypothetical protein
MASHRFKCFASSAKSKFDFDEKVELMICRFLAVKTRFDALESGVLMFHPPRFGSPHPIV